ncbi:MAG: metallophosphoesterase [Planctomycetaceae bacterium]
MSSDLDQNKPWQHVIVPGMTLLLASMVLMTPIFEGNDRGRLGVLLIIAALLEFTHGFRRLHAADQRAAWKSAAVSLLLGLALYSAGWLAVEALRWFLAIWFVLDGIREVSNWSARRKTSSDAAGAAVVAITWFIVAGIIVWLSDQWLTWMIAASVSLRIFNTARTMYSASLVSPELLTNEELTTGLLADPGIRELAVTVVAEETSRAAADRSWILAFLMTLLAIHLGRMGLDRTSLGLVSPGFAVLGDAFVALLIAFTILIPSLMATGKILQVLEGRIWRWSFKEGHSLFAVLRLFLRWLLMVRLRQAIRLRLARCSYAAALSRGLQMGLPLSAILAATTPVWGMSWYFDTENWAAGIWNSWAEQRTDDWRLAMAEALPPSSASDGQLPLEVQPEGLVESEDFSFIIIGDPGEGDASQHSLRSQLLEVSRQPDVKFVVISSDVVYPSGAMKDYEARFWLPFMGVTKPVYAIPGNHDWYDALEGFAATFFEPEAARTAIKARVEIDNHLTSTTDSHIEQLIAEATRLQRLYRVPVQRQKLPYFQLQTDTFALFAVDTGVARQIDPAQQLWLEAGLRAAAGKTKMVLLGHPFYAGGHDQTDGIKNFESLKDLLTKYEVDIIMGGDTHDLEYYLEHQKNASGDDRLVRHFVNGGGGAYLSFGTSLDWPESPITEEWAIYPGRQQVVSKIDATAPFWKQPAWFWTRQFGGWPFSAEWLSAAFDSNQAPFFQSFLEIKVEPSQQRLRLIPWGVSGRLKYSDVQRSTSMIQPGDVEVEWIIPLRESDTSQAVR